MLYFFNLFINVNELDIVFYDGFIGQGYILDYLNLFCGVGDDFFDFFELQ